MFILALGIWSIYGRLPRNNLPKLNELRALIVFFLVLMTFSFWLFYGVRILDQYQPLQPSHQFDYYKILQFSSTYVDCLLLVFILSVFLIEIKHLNCEYVVSVYRSPDGQSKTYSIGSMSIQRAAQYVLEMYYRDFMPYNPWLENAHRKRAIQLMQLEQQQQLNTTKTSTKSRHNKNDDDLTDTKSIKRSSSSTNAAKKNQKMNANCVLNANDRLLEEYEFDKRLKKRRAKLICVTEEAFNHIKRVQQPNQSSQNDQQENAEQLAMDPYDTAQAIFSSIARDLRRFLRVTRQQPFFTRESIVAHLAQCIAYDISPRAFLQRYLDGESLGMSQRALENAYIQQTACMFQNENATASDIKTDQNWILICENLLYQNIEKDLQFVLKQNEVTLQCNFRRLPRFNLIEDILDPKRNKFMIKLNSETTV
jgi:vang-like